MEWIEIGKNRKTAEMLVKWGVWTVLNYCDVGVNWCENNVKMRKSSFE